MSKNEDKVIMPFHGIREWRGGKARKKRIRGR